MGEKNIAFEPFHQIVWWGVPLANYVVPYYTTKELVERSAPLSVSGVRQVPPFGLTTWWRHEVVGSVAAGISTLTAPASYDTRVLTFLGVVGTIETILAIQGYMEIIEWVNRMQADRLAVLGATRSGSL